MKMGGQEILHSSVEKYLGDLIHEKGCEQSIKETVKKRIQGLISKSDEIIQIADSPIMGGLGNSTIAFRLFEATIIPALLHNAESWIGITDSIIKDLQDFGAVTPFSLDKKSSESELQIFCLLAPTFGAPTHFS